MIEMLAQKEENGNNLVTKILGEQTLFRTDMFNQIFLLIGLESYFI